MSPTEHMVLPVKLVLSCLYVLSLHLFFISVLKLLIWLFADQMFAPDSTRNGWGDGVYTWMQREEFSVKPEYAQKILYLDIAHDCHKYLQLYLKKNDVGSSPTNLVFLQVSSSSGRYSHNPSRQIRSQTSPDPFAFFHPTCPTDHKVQLILSPKYF